MIHRGIGNLEIFVQVEYRLGVRPHLQAVDRVVPVRTMHFVQSRQLGGAIDVNLQALVLGFVKQLLQNPLSRLEPESG
ncbi:MAG: hypothetical protein H6R26_3634 [Proteobacteria bacterium]|nr:hypothetical protein [Pseudomonadota bacterium]